MAERALATAYVNIVPGTKAMKAYLEGGITKDAAAGGKNAGTAFGNAFKKVAGAAMFAVAAKQVADFVGSAVSSANKLFIEYEGVNSVFGEAAGSVQAFAKTAAKTAGISESAALAAAKGFGGFATSAKLGAAEAAKFSIDLTKAAGDMASFYGGGTQQALDSIKSALMGQYEPMLKYNQQLTEMRVRQEAVRLKLTETTKDALDPNTKALAVQSLIMQGLGVATGDFVTYADSFDNAQQTMTANFENMKASIGTSLLPVLGQLVTAINPLIEKAGPLLFSVFQKLIPLFDLVIATLDKLMPALEPIIAIFGSLIDIIVSVLQTALGPIIDAITVVAKVVAPVIAVFAKLIGSILKPLGVVLTNVIVPIIETLGAILETFLVPILEIAGAVVGALVEAFVPLQDVFTGLTKTVLNKFIGILKKYVLPIMSRLVELVILYVVPAIETFANWIANAAKSAIPALVEGFKNLMKFLKPVWDFLKPVVEALMAMMGIKPIKITASVVTKDETGGAASFLDYSKLGNGKNSQAENGKKLVKSLNTFQKQYAKIDATFWKAIGKAEAQYSETATKLNKQRLDDLAAAEAEHTKNILGIQDDFIKRLADIVQQSKDRLRNAFQQVAAIDIGSLFTDGGTVDKLIASLKNKLMGARDLVANAGKLASAGFSQTFIEQVVAQGPEAGNAMAKAILESSPAAQKEVQTLFAESEVLANTGMDALANTIYEKSGLATEALKTLYANTQVELATALEDAQAAYVAKQAEIQLTFTEGMLAAGLERDKAIEDATAAFNSAMKSLATEFAASMKTYKKQLSSYADQVSALATKIMVAQSLMGGKASSSVSKLALMAEGGFVTKATPAIVGEAGPEVITPLKEFERMMNLGDGGNGKTINYYAAPNNSLDAEQALFTAIKRAKVVGTW